MSFTLVQKKNSLQSHPPPQNAMARQARAQRVFLFLPIGLRLGEEKAMGKKTQPWGTGVGNIGKVTDNNGPLNLQCC